MQASLYIDVRQCLRRRVIETAIGCHNGDMSRDLVRVLSTSSILEGEIAKSRLQDEGIPALLKGGGADPYGTGISYVFVPVEYEVQARLVLETIVGPNADAIHEPEGT